MPKAKAKYDKLSSRVGRIHERPYLKFNFYGGLTSRFGVLSGVLIGYLEYLTKTDPPSHEEAMQTPTLSGQTQVQNMAYYPLPLEPLTEDLRAILKTPLKRNMVQRRLKELMRLGLVHRKQLGAGRDSTWHYALDGYALGKLLMNKEIPPTVTGKGVAQEVGEAGGPT